MGPLQEKVLLSSEPTFQPILHFCVKGIVSKCMPNDLKDIKEIKSKGQLGVEND